MKFNRILAAALPVISLAASAQSSITLFGIVDVNGRYVKNSDLPSNMTMNNSGLSSGRFGFRGTEDLGGGLRAEFWLESDLYADTRSEEHTSELQSQSNLVCRLLLEKKKNNFRADPTTFDPTKLRPTRQRTMWSRAISCC